MRRLPLLLASLALAWPAMAQEARIAIQTETSSLDPHFALVGANQAVARHIFEALVGSDRDLKPVPGLTEFSNPEPDVWEFRIRPDARFHDGSPVTAEDLRFSLERMPRVPNSPAPFIRLAGSVTAIEVVDQHTIRLRSRGPDPSIPLNAMSAWIVSARVAADATTADFNSGRATIGSGPWRFVEWQRGQALRLARNDDYWGEKPAFATATLRPVANDTARMAALLAGDADLIEAVPPGEIARLRARPELRVTASPSSRMIYIGLDQANDPSPFVTARDGSALAANPLKDVRVRQALSLGINRAAIVERVLAGAARPTGQLAVRGQLGFDPDLPVPEFDVAQARRLLAEAAFPNGFRITLHSPNNRYVEDDKTAQAVAQFWARIGLDARVEVMPSNVFFTRAGRREFSAFLIGFGHTTGDAWLGMSQVLQSYDAQRGIGGLNRGRYASAGFDAAMDAARGVVDGARRDALLRQAQQIAAREVGIIPLHFPDNVWAHRAAFTYAGGVEESTLAHHLAPVR
ncbi:ABC transporter substrate-binding protein [Falsiroseomonas tokyonensis]|uniref:ABC transporter substrate-binding protein n=1 Tax=Falsiroseomonas tokyonensis TaxID=430521 RepID=A0ABV7BXX2_9PROT|nr:ABC transporter substrate-binding protein [Falsiroseomonas tokyonensis]MBU8540409.1 ABC transporter substrate-binding protein [Falsiroseomonas tokyonensis]